MQLNLSIKFFIATASLLFLSGCQHSQLNIEKETAETVSYKVILKQEPPSILPLGMPAKCPLKLITLLNG